MKNGTFLKKILKESEELFSMEPYDKCHAWLDLALLADDAGQLKISLKTLQSRWNWNSKRKVWDFLNTLSKNNKILMQGTTTGTEITILQKNEKSIQPDQYEEIFSNYEAL